MTEKISSKFSRQTGEFLYKLVRAAINDEPAPSLPEDCTWQEVFNLANHNSISVLAYYGMLKSPDKPDEMLSNYWKKAVYAQAARSVQFDVMLEQLYSAMEKADIEYLPIKGALIKHLYPKQEMREMSDVDILYRIPTDEERLPGGLSQKTMQKLMDEMGAESLTDKGMVDAFWIKPTLLFEMHRDFLGPDQKDFDYYHQIWDRAFSSDSSLPHHKSVSLEEQYVLMLRHSFKHFQNRGCGPREIFDCYLFNKCHKGNLNWAAVENLLKQMNMVEYEAMLKRLGQIVFENLKPTSSDTELLDRFMQAGTYGTIDNSVENELKRKEEEGLSRHQARLQYIKDRLILDPEFLKTQFPFFYKHPSLRGLLLIYRIFRGLTTGRDALLREARALKEK